MLRNLMSFDNTSDQSLIFSGGQYGFLSSVSTLTTPGRTGPYCLTQNGGGNPRWSVATFDNQPTWTVGCAFNYSSAVTNQTIIQVCDGTVGGPSNAQSTVQFACGLNTLYGVYAAYNGGTKNSANALWRPGTWNYIEVSGTCSASATVTVRLNGVVVVTATAVNTITTGNSFASLICLSVQGGGLSFDDVYICDGVAAAHGPANNSFLGDIAVFAAFPNADGTYATWTPTAGSNFTCVDSRVYSDSTYVSTATAGNIDSYTFPTTLAASGAIPGVQLNVTTRKDDGGSHVLAPFYRGGSTDYPQTGADLNVTNSYQNAQCQFDYNPNGNVAWTAAAVNAGEFGQKLIS